MSGLNEGLSSTSFLTTTTHIMFSLFNILDFSLPIWRTGDSNICFEIIWEIIWNKINKTQHSFLLSLFYSLVICAVHDLKREHISSLQKQSPSLFCTQIDYILHFLFPIDRNQYHFLIVIFGLWLQLPAEFWLIFPWPKGTDPPFSLLMQCSLNAEKSRGKSEKPNLCTVWSHGWITQE